MPHVTRPVRFTSGKEIDSCVLKSDSLIVKIDLNTGFISYLNTDGSLLLREDGKLPSWRKEGDGACRIRRTIQTY